MNKLSFTMRTQRLTIIGAHLSSAAIRMASVEDVLKQAQVANPSYLDWRAYFHGEKRFADSEPRARTCSDWFHVMLRDNATHVEPPQAPTGRKAKRCRIRQTCIENTTFADAYSKLREISKALHRFLTVRHDLVLPNLRM